MDQRCRFVQEFETGDFTMAELCRQYGISRETGHKWWNRYQDGGVAELEDRSRVPKHNPRAVDEALVKAIIEAREAHRTWGARKILAWLERRKPGLESCSASAANELLSRHGLIVSRKRRHKSSPSNHLTDDGLVPNKVWCADFKGWFLCGDGKKCTPLTITDQATRFILKLQSLREKTDAYAVLPLFDAAFGEFGLPEIIRTDNGPPFASNGLGGLTRLSVHWIELGIIHERIRPGKPQENARHERMHKTLKAETASPPMRTGRLQQKRFEAWREEFNFERPHEALDDKSPGELYSASPRSMPTRIRPWSYGDDVDEVRHVSGIGQFKWRCKEVYASLSLVGRPIGLKRLSDNDWEVWFRGIRLGILDARKSRIIKPGKQMNRILERLGLLDQGGGPAVEMPS